MGDLTLDDFAPGVEVEVQGYHPKVDGAQGVVIEPDLSPTDYVHVDLPGQPLDRWLFKPEELVKV
jgi:hypothetical protein